MLKHVYDKNTNKLADQEVKLKKNAKIFMSVSQLFRSMVKNCKFNSTEMINDLAQEMQ